MKLYLTKEQKYNYLIWFSLISLTMKMSENKYIGYYSCSDKIHFY